MDWRTVYEAFDDIRDIEVIVSQGLDHLWYFKIDVNASHAVMRSTSYYGDKGYDTPKQAKEAAEAIVEANQYES